MKFELGKVVMTVGANTKSNVQVLRKSYWDVMQTVTGEIYR